MPTPLHLKPPFAAWLVRERNARKWKPRDVVAALAAQGIEVTDGTVKVWESNAGRKPAPLTIDALERIFDSRAPESVAPSAGQADLVAALDRQSAAIESLVSRLDLLLFPNPEPDVTVLEVAERIRARRREEILDEWERELVAAGTGRADHAAEAIRGDEARGLRTTQLVRRDSKGSVD